MIYPIKYSENLNFSIISKRAVELDCDANDTLPPLALLLLATKWKLVYNNGIFWFVFVDATGIFHARRRLAFSSVCYVLHREAARQFVSELREDWTIRCHVEEEVYQIGSTRFRTTIEKPIEFERLMRKWSLGRATNDCSHLAWTYRLFQPSRDQDTEEQSRPPFFTFFK